MIEGMVWQYKVEKDEREPRLTTGYKKGYSIYP